MLTIADALARVPFLRDVPRDEIDRAARHWTRVPLTDGQDLWTEGGLAMELGVVLDGELIAITRGVVLGPMRVGELAGEASAFLRGESRSATVRARGASVVATLPVKALAALRREANPIYDALLDQALITVVRRIRATDERIAALSRGDREAPVRREASVLVRMWRALRPGRPGDACPPLEPLLRKQPVLRGAEADTIRVLAAVFQPQMVQEGEILFLEGSAGDAAYVVVDGAIEVLRAVGGDRAELLATLGPGEIFGANALIERAPRTASCVAAQPGWLYRVDAASLPARATVAGRLWRETLLATFASQIRSANAALKARAEHATDPLLRASAALLGTPLQDAHINAIDAEAHPLPARNPWEIQ